MMETLSRFVFIGMGGALGAILRAQTAIVVARLMPRHLWMGTMAANIIGCVAFAILKAWMDSHNVGSEQIRLVVFTGILGAYTTFSTFESDAWSMWSGGDRWLAMAYLAGSVITGFAAFGLTSAFFKSGAT
jgi:CrcB protein